MRCYPNGMPLFSPRLAHVLCLRRRTALEVAEPAYRRRMRRHRQLIELAASFRADGREPPDSVRQALQARRGG